MAAAEVEVVDTGVQQFVHRDNLLPGVISTAVGYCYTGATPCQHRGLPSPYLTVVFSLDEPIVSARHADELGTPTEQRTDILAAGLQTEPAFVAMPSEQAGIQLAVHPLAARALLGASSAELGFVLDGIDVFGEGAERLRLRLIETPSWERRFSLLAEFLRVRVDSAGRGAEPRPELSEAWRWLRRGGGSVADLARHVALSPRQLNAVFTSELGLGPKSAARLVRFTRALRMVTSPIAAGVAAVPDLASVAADCGYYDQSHLVREFRSFVGTSPTGWLAEERRNVQAGGHRNGES